MVRIRRVQSVRSIRNPYSKRILTRVIGKDPVEVLAATPRKLSALVSGLSHADLRRKPRRDKWSIAELVCHLADAELVLAFRYRMAIAQSGSRLQPIDEGKWAKNLGYRSQDVRQKLLLFSFVRRDHIRFLRSLSSREWKRYGMHDERGKETVERMAQMYAGHDLNHLEQIRSIRQWLRRK